MLYEVVIGLEIHTQLATRSKMFCTCANKPESPPNANICPVCLGHPGTLPVVNRKAVEWAVMIGLALSCQISKKSKFDRKNYFYPDLPKGYQISQYDEPLCKEGFLEIKSQGKRKKIGLERVHLEEDAGKLIHPEGKNYSLIDFNRAGIPLLEIVTKPELRTPDEAKIFLQELQKLLRYIGASDADMEKGQLRCDANISLRKTGEKAYSPKTEIKNMNSFRALERALKYEIKRQTELWEEGRPPKVQATRSWNETKQITEEIRVKEEAEDYRYFPEPDLPSIEISKTWISRLNDWLPELPKIKKQRYQVQFGLSEREIEILTADRLVAEFFEHAVSEAKEWLLSFKPKASDLEIQKIIKLTSNWTISRLFGLLKEADISMKECKISPENFAELISMIYENKISSAAAQKVLGVMFKRGADPSQVVEEMNLAQMTSQEELEKVVEQVLKNNPWSVSDYKKGKTQALQYLIGQVMALTSGKADPKLTAEILKKKLM